MTANQLAYDRTMDRVAMLDSYERGILKKLDITIDQHFSDTLSLLQDPRLDKADPQLISELLERQRSVSKGNIKNILERSLRDLANDQVAYQVNSIDKIAGKFWNTQQPGKSLDIVTLEVYLGKTIDSRISSIFAKERLKIEKLVRTSLGKDISTAFEKSKVKNYLKNEIKTLGITSTTSTTVSADFLVFNANKGILKGWQYFAILDLSTSRICRFRAGRVFRLDQTEMYPPAHPNCRSKPLMIFKSLSELSDEESPQVRKRNLIKANRSDFSKFSGEIIRGHSYNDWLKKQPFIIKLKQLGSQTAVNAVEQGKLLAHDVFNAKGDTIGITTLRKLTADNLVPGTVSQFTTAKEKLDALRLAAATPDDFLKDEELKRNLKTYYLLQNGELNGTLSLTNYRGQLIGTKAATKRRVLNSPPTDDQQIFNPFTNRYEDARLYRPNPAVLENAKRLVTTSEELLSKDKLFITEVVDSLSDKMGTNERAVVSDNLRILFERYRRNREPWLNFKAVAQSQIKFDVMNISESLETRVRSDSDFLKKFSQSVYLDPILGDIQLQDLHDSFISNILARNKWEDKTAPRIAEKLRSVFDSKIPLILRSRLSDSDLQQFYLKFAHRLSLADGPDRDQFAVQLGRDLYNLANLNGDKNSWFTTGRDLLESRNVNKFFEIDTFGIQKRRLKSKLSGKYFGPYYDTISYNIRVTDPQILEYSRLNRKIDVGLRVGVLSDKNRLVFRPGYKTYFIDRGVLGLEDTRIPITSTSSFSEFPEELIDKSLADALNWAATAKYKIDPIFYNFVKKLLYFRDDKGKAEHFNDLNVLKKYLVARGDAYERFKAMDWLAAKNEAFSNQPFVDHRLRIYDRGLISPQSGETFRPFLNTADLKPLGTEGFETLMDQAGAFLGGLDDYFEGNYNSLTVSGRQGVFKKWQKQLIILGNHIIRGKPDDIRQILESEFTSRIDGEELGKLYRLSLEIAKVDNYLKTGNPLENKGAAVIYSRKTLAKLDKYLTDFAIEQDASSSGAQIIALTTRNKALAELSNVVPTSQKRRLYDEIAARTFRDPEFTKLNEKLGLSEKDLRKASKAQNMVTFSNHLK